MPPPKDAGAFKFQSTSLVRGTTGDQRLQLRILNGFQSTSLVRGTTLKRNELRDRLLISIHVPRERDDGKSISEGHIMQDFNPRPS